MQRLCGAIDEEFKNMKPKEKRKKFWKEEIPLGVKK